MRLAEGKTSNVFYGGCTLHELSIRIGPIFKVERIWRGTTTSLVASQAPPPEGFSHDNPDVFKFVMNDFCKTYITRIFSKDNHLVCMEFLRDINTPTILYDNTYFSDYGRALYIADFPYEDVFKHGKFKTINIDSPVYKTLLATSIRILSSYINEFTSTGGVFVVPKFKICEHYIAADSSYQSFDHNGMVKYKNQLLDQVYNDLDRLCQNIVFLDIPITHSYGSPHAPWGLGMSHYSSFYHDIVADIFINRISNYFKVDLFSSCDRIPVSSSYLSKLFLDFDFQIAINSISNRRLAELEKKVWKCRLQWTISPVSCRRFVMHLIY